MPQCAPFQESWIEERRQQNPLLLKQKDHLGIPNGPRRRRSGSQQHRVVHKREEK